MVAGNDTFIHSMMALAGFQNILAQNRYPVMSNEELMQLNPEVVLLSSEPYPFKEQHKEEIMQLFSNSKIAIVDGECFSWYGSRMKGAFDYFKELRAEIN